MSEIVREYVPNRDRQFLVWTSSDEQMYVRIVAEDKSVVHKSFRHVLARKNMSYILIGAYNILSPRFLFGLHDN